MFYYNTIHCALLALLVANLVIANLVITITSLYDLTIYLFIELKYTALSYDVWTDPPFKIKYPCFLTAGYCVKDPGLLDRL